MGHGQALLLGLLPGKVPRRAPLLTSIRTLCDHCRLNDTIFIIMGSSLHCVVMMATKISRACVNNHEGPSHMGSQLSFPLQPARLLLKIAQLEGLILGRLALLVQIHFPTRRLRRTILVVVSTLLL